jgi:hypothetical protein
MTDEREQLLLHCIHLAHAALSELDEIAATGKPIDPNENWVSQFDVDCDVPAALARIRAKLLRSILS